MSEEEEESLIVGLHAGGKRGGNKNGAAHIFTLTSSSAGEELI